MQDILNQLPEGYKEACRETKAMQRRKEIQNEDILLILCLYAELHITPECTGETLENFSFHANDLVIADRIYATISGIEHCKKTVRISFCVCAIKHSICMTRTAIG